MPGVYPFEGEYAPSVNDFVGEVSTRADGLFSRIYPDPTGVEDEYLITFENQNGNKYVEMRMQDRRVDNKPCDAHLYQVTIYADNGDVLKDLTFDSPSSASYRRYPVYVCYSKTGKGVIIRFARYRFERQSDQNMAQFEIMFAKTNTESTAVICTRAIGRTDLNKVSNLKKIYMFTEKQAIQGISNSIDLDSIEDIDVLLTPFMLQDGTYTPYAFWKKQGLDRYVFTEEFSINNDGNYCVSNGTWLLFDE